MTDNLLSIIVWLPLIGAVATLLLWKWGQTARIVALITALIEFGLTLTLLPLQAQAVSDSNPFLLLQDLPWIEMFGIRYTLALDGISLLLVLLTAFITLIAILASWRQVKEKVAFHFACIMLISAGIMGVFLSFDLFLFYLFWELMLVPMLFLIGIWGHGRRVYSAVKFFLVTFVGSLLMLLAIIALHLLHYGQTGTRTFAFTELMQTQINSSLSIWLFAAFLLSFAIKIPLIPVHTWLPDAHTDAPTAGSVILAGLLLKTGAYGLLRFAYPLFPAGASFWTPTILVLSVAGILYASWIAYAQTDIKRLVAYSSIGHMGFVALGIAAWTPVSLSGSIIQMVNHGVTTGALFAMVGMLDERGNSRDINAYGGLWGKIPVYSGFFLLFAISSVGLPGLNNFVGEFLILVGAFKVTPLAVILAFMGIVLPLIYMARLVQELLFTKEHKPVSLSDLNGREYLMLIMLAAADIYVGVHPKPLLDMLALPVKILTVLPGATP